MKITFRIQYRTVWGESLCVLLSQNHIQHTVEMTTRNGEEWTGKAEFDFHPSEPICYRYAVSRQGTLVRQEFGAIPHSFYPGNLQQQHYLVEDCWRDLPQDAYRYTSAFNNTYTLEQPSRLSDNTGRCITFRALCPGLSTHRQRLGLIGSCAALGSWEYCRPLRMKEVQPNVWHLTLDASSLEYPFEYKFVAIHEKTGAVEKWENRPNRIFPLQPLQRGETYLPMETEVFFDDAPQRIAGCAIPVFSLRSEGSCGVGDFGDLKLLADWADETGQKAIQILPINDTTMSGTWTDSYPYNSISIYAFHPMYIDLRQLPALKDKKAAEAFEKARIEVNSLPMMDYEKANKLKMDYLRKVYQMEGKKVLASEEFLNFFQHNEEWLQPYAAFCYLRDSYGTPDFNHWPKYSTYDADEIARLCTPGNKAYTKIAFYYYLQYQLHVQLLAVSTYARAKGILLKGDIPIGISRSSVEAWVEPHYFHLNGQAGAPPDAFSVNGQNWGFPTYNWEVMEKDNYRWWRRRFSKMAEYFTAYRIDHILGFFRIWEIPDHSVHGLLGQFSPSLPLSMDEIRSFGLNLDREFMTQPFINDKVLEEVFGTQSEYVRQHFITPNGKGGYALLPEFDTQRKVEAYFNGKEDEDSLKLKEGLYSLISNVLFVTDHHDAEKLHPRIAVQNDSVFQQLNWKQQGAFNHLYNHYYYQRHNEFWYQEAMKKLPVLTQSTPMLVCGEDLGMVPECVPWVMRQLQILSLEIQRMPKQMYEDFGHPENYPFLSVCTIGTHDMSTFRGWWEEDPALTERFYHQEMHHQGEIPVHAPGWLCKDIVFHHLKSPSLLCILAWQDWMSINEQLRNPDIEGERINIPAHPRHYWRWRMHLTLEQLLKEKELNQTIRELIEDSNRR
ncbi:4-alpha-glucanotransferase [Phocaeicola plebeius]|uniref:4-alpha-glucanotransferase n=1 Tax=Phocaeicola plebeius TaxID=310297 RepID=UPI0026DC0598|nr:4-alpha-glucanotransferase [Phocaeicola plebeius]